MRPAAQLDRRDGPEAAAGSQAAASASRSRAEQRFAFLPDSDLVDAVVASPNHGERRGGRTPDLLLLHYTGMPAGRGLTMAERAIRWLCASESEVSCHYVVDEHGTVTQLVPEARRAWHAGAGSWAGETDINSVSIGIEIAHPGHPWDLARAPDAAPGEPAPEHPGYLPFPEAQVAAVAALSRDIVSRHGIRPERVLAHSDIAPSRKRDPGEGFPWARLAAQGVGLVVEPAQIAGGRFFTLGDAGRPVEALQVMLGLLGYGIAATGTFDQATADVVTAFQRHWRPARVDGVADASTMTTLHRLLGRIAPADGQGGLA
jgi:N-acetylmuramoyl-L-alanine amidase